MKTRLLIVSTALLLTLPSIAFAEERTTTGSSTKPTMFQQRQDRKETAITKMIERRDVRITKTQERGEAKITKQADREVTRTRKQEEREKMLTERLTKIGTQMLTRAKEQLQRLNQIFDRVLARVEKFKTNGKDVSGLDPLIAEARTNKDKANTAITKAESSLASIGTSSNPKEAYQTITSTLKDVKTALKNYHQSIVTIVNHLKGMSEGTRETKPTISISKTEDK